jgi:hypothetical protein
MIIFYLFNATKITYLYSLIASIVFTGLLGIIDLGIFGALMLFPFIQLIITEIWLNPHLGVVNLLINIKKRIKAVFLIFIKYSVFMMLFIFVLSLFVLNFGFSIKDTIASSGIDNLSENIVICIAAISFMKLFPFFHINTKNTKKDQKESVIIYKKYAKEFKDEFIDINFFYILLLLLISEIPDFTEMNQLFLFMFNSLFLFASSGFVFASGFVMTQSMSNHLK